MQRLITHLLIAALAILLTGVQSSIDQAGGSDGYAKIDIKEVEKVEEEWHSSLNPEPIEFKHFEAIVKDPDGKQYAIVASIAGNKFRYESYAWLANTEKWYEIYRASPKVESSGPDVWTKDGNLVFTGNMGAGWRIKASGDEASFELSSVPERPVPHYSVNGLSANFNGYISFRTKIDGKITVDRQDKLVTGFGYCLHTYGNMGKHAAWKYFSFRDEKLCITVMNAQFDKDRMMMFVTVDDGKEMVRYEPDRISWQEIDQNTWKISAKGHEQNGNAKQLDISIRLVKPRPTNESQPYSEFSVRFIGGVKTFLYEYLADVRVVMTGPGADDNLELRSPGIATRFDLIR